MVRRGFCLQIWLPFSWLFDFQIGRNYRVAVTTALPTWIAADGQTNSNDELGATKTWKWNQMKRTAWNGCDEIQDEKGCEAENILAAWWQRCCKRFRRCSRIRSGPEFSCSLTVLSPDTWRRERWPDSCTDANHNWSLGFQVGIVFFVPQRKWQQRWSETVKWRWQMANKQDGQQL